MTSLVLWFAFALPAISAGALTPASPMGPATAPVCVLDHMVTTGHKGLPATMEWADSSGGQRRVTVVFDERGEPLQYSELKTSGTVSGFDRIGAYRLVFLNFETGLAVLEVQESGPDDRVQEQREISDLLLEKELGPPSETINQVKAACTKF